MSDMRLSSARRPERLHEWIAAELTRRIATDVYEEGTLLPSEAELGVEFAASRTAVREALKVLASKGLVGIEHGRGSRINRFESWNIFDRKVIEALRASPSIVHLLEELVEVREMIEVRAAELAAERVTPLEMEELEACLREMATVLTEPARFFELDIQFHELLIASTNNLVLRRLVGPVRELLMTARQHVIGVLSRARLERSLQGHQEILAAIARGEPKAAGEAMTAHLDQAREEFWIATEAKHRRGGAKGVRKNS